MQEQGQRLTLENLAKSIPERINVAKERMKSDSLAREEASQVWAKRGEKYDAFSSELGNSAADFLKDYVARLWPTICCVQKVLVFKLAINVLSRT